MSYELSRYFLQAMNIDIWLEREPYSACEKQLTALTREVLNCTHCAADKTALKPAFFRGHIQAKLMIIGEAPDIDDEQQKLPSRNQSDCLLQHMIKTIGISENDVYMTQIFKCMLPDHRNPEIQGDSQCGTEITRQIAFIQPKAILALGCFAGQLLLDQPLTIEQLRNQLHDYNTIPFIVSYHPDHLLRHPADKKKAYADLMILKASLS